MNKKTEKIIDTHSHYMPPQVAQHTAFFKVGWSDLNRQIAIMDQCGIAQALLLYPTSDAHLNLGGWNTLARTYNQSIAEILSKHRNRFYGACIVPFGDKEALKEELKFFEDGGFQFFSLASSYEGTYLDDELFYDIFEFAQDKNIPIHVHPQILNPIGEERLKDPLLSPVLEYVFDVSVCIGKMMMNGTFSKFPKVKFIFAHYGGVLPIVKERFDNTYQMLRKRNFVKDLNQLPSDYFKNLYFDTSGSKSLASLLCALEVVEPSRILFGSDYPANQNIAESIEVVLKSPLDQNQKSLILTGNFSNLVQDLSSVI